MPESLNDVIRRRLGGRNTGGKRSGETLDPPLSFRPSAGVGEWLRQEAYRRSDPHRRVSLSEVISDILEDAMRAARK